MDFRDRDSVVPNLITVAAVLALVGGLALQWLPKPSDPHLVSRTRAETTSVLEQKKKTDEMMATSKAYVENLTWSGEPDQINETILNRVNALIKKNSLKLSSLRPQRANTVDDLDTMPYLVIVEGTFPQIVQFARDLDVPANKLATSLIQISTADTNSGRVTANIAVVAYLNPKTATTTLKKEDAKTHA